MAFPPNLTDPRKGRRIGRHGEATVPASQAAIASNRAESALIPPEPREPSAPGEGSPAPVVERTRVTGPDPFRLLWSRRSRVRVP
jgi:hypothetical protein